MKIETHVLLLLLFGMTSLAAEDLPPLQTVPKVDLMKYMGTWYEISSFPQRFQKGCRCTTAEYSMTDKGYVLVLNRCRKDSTSGKLSQARGKAFVVEGARTPRMDEALHERLVKRCADKGFDTSRLRRTDQACGS
ncbi:MAG: lipocalin family protein [Candidatus Aminicenantes bacterium]|nr:lipocalin family protein [Candidatus Aminicenantes bacterium]